jgi:hypothetical protein
MTGIAVQDQAQTVPIDFSTSNTSRIAAWQAIGTCCTLHPLGPGDLEAHMELSLRVTSTAAWRRRAEAGAALMLALGLMACSGQEGSTRSGGAAGGGGSNAGGSPGSGGSGLSGGNAGSGVTGGSAGVTGNGGVNGNGGATGSGGATGNGGATGSGGKAGSGGAIGSGGATGSGGGATGSGGATGGAGGQPPATGDITCRKAGDGITTVVFVNRCAGVLSFRGSDITGGDLKPGEYACRTVGTATESLPAKRYWGFIGQDPGAEKHTLAEFTFNTTFYDFDWYNLSHVDASNLPMQIAPAGMPKCRVLTCAQNLLPGCPAIGQFKDSSGSVISCVSPDRNNANSPVALYFDAACVDAYSWSGDDAKSMASCAGEDYDIVFCPTP